MAEKLLHSAAAVGRGAIPDDDLPARHFAQQVCEERDHVVRVEGGSWLWQYSLPSGEMALMAERWSRVHHSRRIGVCPTGA
jgi:hypothetical protein